MLSLTENLNLSTLITEDTLVERDNLNPDLQNEVFYQTWQKVSVDLDVVDQGPHEDCKFEQKIA